MSDGVDATASQTSVAAAAVAAENPTGKQRNGILLTKMTF